MLTLGFTCTTTAALSRRPALVFRHIVVVAEYGRLKHKRPSVRAGCRIRHPAKKRLRQRPRRGRARYAARIAMPRLTYRRLALAVQTISSATEPYYSYRRPARHRIYSRHEIVTTAAHNGQRQFRHGVLRVDQANNLIAAALYRSNAGNPWQIPYRK